MIRYIAEHKDHQVPDPDGGAGLRWGVEPICAVLSEHGVPISPSTYHEWITKAPTRRQLRDTELVDIIAAQRQDKRTGKFGTSGSVLPPAIFFVFSENFVLGRRQDAVQAAQDREGQDDVAVLVGLVWPTQ